MIQMAYLINLIQQLQIEDITNINYLHQHQTFIIEHVLCLVVNLEQV